MSYINWKAYADRLQPFDGNLIPVFKNGKRISGAVKDHNFTVKKILTLDGVRAIELRTSKQLMCLDFDSLEAIRFAETEGGFLLKDLQTWLVKRDNQKYRCKFFFFRNKDQQSTLGEFVLDIKEHDLEIFSKSTKPATVLGLHRESGLYRWYGTDPSIIKLCPPKLWDFIVDQYQKKNQTIQSSKSSSNTWRPIRPCPICDRIKDNDCFINRDRNFIQCHKGKTNNPPSLKVGETIKRQGQEWAFCGTGNNAIGEFSKFKMHISTPTPWDIIYGDRK
tara:strand:- start:1336 stop:2166 length:831 start_codon:yes stop_codon:yes gene_type:complete